MIEKRVDDVFDIDSEREEVRISSDAPAELRNAVLDAKEMVRGGAEYWVEDIGKLQRPIEYGGGELRILQTESATIFSREEPDGRVKMVSVGVSSNGSLNDEQISLVLRDMGASARLTPEEMQESKNFAKAIRSIKQSKLFVIQNSKRISLSIARLTQVLSEINQGTGDLEEKTEAVETDLHNLLSSVYTYMETARNSLRTLDVLNEYNHHLQKYQDANSTAIGLRHCIQHNLTLKVHWVGRYNHEFDMFDFKVVIPLVEVNDPSLYTKEYYYDSSGNQHEPIEYFYSDISGRFIDLEALTDTIKNSSISTYDHLKSELEEDERVVNTNLERFEKISKYYISNFDEQD